MDKTNTIHRVAAAVTTGMLMAESTAAHATAYTFRDITTGIVNSAGGLPMMIETVAYVGGIGLGVTGIFKLKSHVDNPGQHPLKDGLVRLGAGGGLLALPFVTQAMMTSITSGGPNIGVMEGSFSPPTITGG